MYKNTKILILLVIVTTLASCGEGPPEFTRFTMKSNEFGMLLDTSDSDQLGEIHKLFYDRKEANDAGPDFFYIIDVTTKDGTTRWQYSKDGYVMGFSKTDSTIYKLSRATQFNKITNIR